MPLNIVRNDIADVVADAIVNSANRKVCCGRGSETSIYNKAGFADLLKARESIGELDVGEIGVTPAFGLKAKYIIHVSAPRWNDGRSGELIALRACYTNALRKATDLGCKSIAFPLLSSGNFRFPKDLALYTATGAINEFLQSLPESSELSVLLVVFDEKAFEISKKLQDDIEDFISEHFIDEMQLGLFAQERSDSMLLEKSSSIESEMFVREWESPHASAQIKSVRELEDILKDTPRNQNQAFFERFDKFVSAKGMSNAAVYKAANMSRDRFSKIQGGQNQITRENAIALALGLKLNLEDTRELIACAGYTLSRSSKFDVIIEYFITNGIFDVAGAINSYLAKQNMPTLGNAIKWG